MNYKLVAIDCDNTLLDSRGYIPQENINVIKRLKTQGVHFIIATGRSDILAKDYLDELELELPIISNNGGALTNLYTNEFFYINPIAKESLTQIFNYCNNSSIPFKALSLSCCYTNDPIAMKKGISQIVTKYKRKMKYTIEYKFMENINSLIGTTDILKTVIINDNRALLLHYQEELKKIPDINVYRSGFNCIDMVAKNVSKGNALKKYAESLNVKPNEIIAFGDGENDMDMLEFAGLGIAMKNGEELLKNKADYITDTNDNCGVAKALNKFFNL